MIYTELTKIAMQISFDAHKDCKDRGGAPYIFHPMHIAEQMQTEEEICVALLHDVIEDSDITAEQLADAGFSSDVVTAVVLLTHSADEPYFAYIERIKGCPLAKKVKIADLRHNLDTTRLKWQNESVYERLGKYRQALAMLTGCEC